MDDSRVFFVLNSKDGLGWRDGSTTFWLLIAFLALVFVSGGSSRADVQGLVVLRPLSLVMIGIGLALINGTTIRRNALLLGLGLAPLFIAGFYLLPLPPSALQFLAGHQLPSRVDEIARLGDVWRPLSLYPVATLNAFQSLFIPIAALLLTIQLEKNELQLLFKFVLLLAILAGLIGILQIVGDPRGPLYFYSVTNHGNIVGVFANRNHQAIILAMLFPMLVYLASIQFSIHERSNWLKYFSYGMGIILIPLILVTGSRIGLVAAVAALLASVFLHRPTLDGRVGKNRSKANRVPVIPAAIIVIAALLAVAMHLSRATAFVRLFGAGDGVGARDVAWKIGIDSFGDHSIFGSGPGTFAQTFMINEPNAFLRSSYLNQIHSDWLDIALTTGAVGICLALATTSMILKMAWSVFRAPGGSRTIMLGRLGATMIMLLALGSTTDYPLRTPIMMCLMVIAFTWLTRGTESSNYERAGSR